MNILDKNTDLMKKVEKGWGYELWIHNDEEYCGKLLYFKKGKKCSLHYHEKKKETFYLQDGKLECTFYHLDEPDNVSKVILSAGDSKEIIRGLVHQMKALEDTVLFEFSTQHFEEDSIRIAKGD
jgi:quercetin dioxygenase-like cupin family protein|tara:strand:+ start:1352 stop:1723 length:372 start_codon:yes stop_codon:yes gene_type:complete